MMFDVVRFSKQCRCGYINTVRCLPASDAKSCVCLAYDNEQTTRIWWGNTRIQLSDIPEERGRGWEGIWNGGR